MTEFFNKWTSIKYPRTFYPRIILRWPALLTIILLPLALIWLLAACSQASSTTEEPAAAPGTRPGMGMGRQSGMMARHSAPIPEVYAELANPVTADDASLERGAELYTIHCASCHGDGAMGDGPAAAGLDPAPVPIAHTSQMMSDSYLFWRVSEGGTLEPFNSAMPSWKGVLDEQARWDVINYMRALGSGTAPTRRGVGGAAFDPDAQATREASMVAAAVAQGILTQAEAETFARVHAAVEGLRAQGFIGSGDTPSDMQAQMLAELVRQGTITQEEADTFSDAHSRMLVAGLMD
jgi:mono/diheme cytochrome c family protein